MAATAIRRPNFLRLVVFVGGSWRDASMPNACVSDRRQREAVSRIKTSVEAASCSLDAMVRQNDHCVGSETVI
jgi:hypothetical protein